MQTCGTSSAIHLTIRDFGLGFDLEAAMKGCGLGLISMQERVRLVQGTISIASEAGATAIEVHVPLIAKIDFARAVG